MESHVGFFFFQTSASSPLSLRWPLEMQADKATIKQIMVLGLVWKSHRFSLLLNPIAPLHGFETAFHSVLVLWSQTGLTRSKHCH